MNRTQKRFLNSKRGATRAGLVVLSAVSGFFTYLGADLVLAPAGGGVWVRICAGVFSLGVSTLIYLFWSYALSAATEMCTMKMRGAAGAITAVGCLFLVALSSWMNVTALAGAGALEIHMKETVARYEQAVDAALARSRAAERMIPDLEAAATRYERISSSERNGGALTGVPGSGAITATLESASRQIRDVIAAIGADGTRLELLDTEARERLQRMRDAAGSNKPVSDRIHALATETEGLRAVLTRMSSRDVALSAGRILAALSSAITKGAASANPRVARAQEEAWQRIREDFERTGASLSATAGTIAALPQAALPAFERVTPVSAVLRYGEHFIPYWAGGIALDLCPVLIIAFLMLVGAAGEGAGPRAPSPIGLLTVQELLDAKTAMKRLRDSKEDEEDPSPEDPDLNNLLQTSLKTSRGNGKVRR